MAPELRCLLLLLLLGWGGAGPRNRTPQRRGRPARRVNATEWKAAVLPCGGAGDGAPPAQLALSWLWKGPGGRELLSLNATLGEPPPRAGTALGGRGSLVLLNVSAADAGAYECRWDGAAGGAVLLNVEGSREVYVSGSPGGQAALPCAVGNASETPAAAWFRKNGTEWHVRADPRHRPNGSALLIQGLGPDDSGWYRCQAGNRTGTVHLSLEGEPAVWALAGGTARLPCAGALPEAWVRGALSWARRGPGGARELVALAARRAGTCAFQLSLGAGAALVLPAVTPAQAGTYLCLAGNASHAVELGVAPRAGGWQPWIVGAAELGYVVLGLASLFGYCQIRRAVQTRKRRKHLMDPARRFFKVTANGAPPPHGNALPPTGPTGGGQTEAAPYENVGVGTRRQGRPAERAHSPVESEDEEEYEHPDSEAELAPEEGEGYENTSGEVEVGDSRPSGEPCYENSLEESGAGGAWGAGTGGRGGPGGPGRVWGAPLHPPSLSSVPPPGAPHRTSAGRGPEPEDLESEDGECYENEEGEGSTPLSPGAARLVTDLRLLLLGPCEEAGRDRPDGHSEGSVGSQAYEEMAGALYAAPARHLRFRDCSQEEDADSYENMEEGPGCLLPPREGSVELRGDAAGHKAPLPAGAEPGRPPGPRSGERS